MKRFDMMELYAAYDHAAQGGQALHVCESSQFVTERAPQVFRRSRQFAHLIDNDAERLEATARRLGVRVIKIGRRGVQGQHIDLCGKPLERALALCE